MAALRAENVCVFFCCMENNMPLMLSQFLAEITPASENKIVIALPFPDTDVMVAAQIHDQVRSG
jgi:hypothetical protein